MKRIEKMAEENPTVDFSQVVDLKELDTIVEHVDLFEFKISDEIKQASQMSWHKALKWEAEYQLQQARIDACLAANPGSIDLNICDDLRGY